MELEITALANHGILGLSSERFRALGLDEAGKTTSSSSQTTTPQALVVIASLLEKCIRKNERLIRRWRKDDVVSIFHGSEAPSLSLRQYLERVFNYSKCSTSCFVVAYIYIQRYFHNRPAFSLTSLNVHRLFITAVMVAAKFLDDQCDNNAYFAQVGGVSTEEMNELEIEFLFSLEFKLHVTIQLFDNYCQRFEKKGNSSSSGEYRTDRQSSAHVRHRRRNRGNV
ncbi:cyclin-U4-1-like [Humulus lupulus]|uniref:cyclin-U4-1-like n=1 Tax=Humulus lupulus TaxID=3486 RepID=UPI002B40CA34|nr:cyclin-U4-1-like [Humulus lupulus]